MTVECIDFASFLNRKIGSIWMMLDNTVKLKDSSQFLYGFSCLIVFEDTQIILRSGFVEESTGLYFHVTSLNESNEYKLAVNAIQMFNHEVSLKSINVIRRDDEILMVESAVPGQYATL